MASTNNPLFKNENTIGKMGKKVNSDFMERIDVNAAKGIKGNLGDNHLDSQASIYQPGGEQTSIPGMKSPRRAMDL